MTRKPIRGGLRPVMRYEPCRNMSDMLERLRRGHSDPNRAVPTLLTMLGGIDDDIGLLQATIDELKDEVVSTKGAGSLEVTHLKKKHKAQVLELEAEIKKLKAASSEAQETDG